MDLTQLAITSISDQPPAYFSTQAYQNMVVNLLSRAEFEDGSDIRPDRPKVAPLIQYFQNTNAKLKHFQNPELYQLAINLLLYPDHANCNIALFQAQMGTKTVEELPDLPNGYYRFFHLQEKLYRSVEGKMVEYSDPFYFTIQGCKAKIILPISGLYHDLLSAEIYPETVTSFDQSASTDRLSRAFALIRDYSPLLFNNFEANIHQIVLTPNLGVGKRWSYNLRTRYQGAIFFDPFRIEMPGFLESLIHEYLHQVLWLWWGYEPLSGIREQPDHIFSPVTGLKKKVPVMIHALLIYINVYDLFLYAISRDDLLTNSEGLTIEMRLEKLEASIPKLYGRLKPCVEPQSKAAEFLDLIYGRFKL